MITSNSLGSHEFCLLLILLYFPTTPNSHSFVNVLYLRRISICTTPHHQQKVVSLLNLNS